MLKKYIFPFLVVFLLTSFAAAGFAIVKNLETDTQSMVKVGESVTVPEGMRVKSAVAVGGSVTIYGQVKEDVVAVGGSVYLKDSASVDGDVVAVGGKVVKDPGAIARGEIVEVATGMAPAVAYFTKGGLLKGLLIFGFISFLSFLVLAMILVALFTPQLGRISGSLENNFWRSFLVGLLAVILFFPIILLLMVSIVGIALIPIWVMLFAAACLFGYIAVGHFIGKKTLQAFRLTGRSMMFETLTGIIILSIIGVVPVGGFVVKAIASLCGLGGVYQTRFGTR